MFVNFPRLLEFNAGKLPFGAAQIGPAFRNEIAPRQNLIRVREFTLAEIEYFVDPSDKSHKKFSSVKDVVLPLFSIDCQLNNKPVVMKKVGEAVEEVFLLDNFLLISLQRMIDNETLGYFLVKCYQFLIRIGIKPETIRFRQHLKSEMAHYATDCWDGEILTTFV